MANDVLGPLLSGAGSFMSNIGERILNKSSERSAQARAENFARFKQGLRDEESDRQYGRTPSGYVDKTGREYSRDEHSSLLPSNSPQTRAGFERKLKLEDESRQLGQQQEGQDRQREANMQDFQTKEDAISQRPGDSEREYEFRAKVFGEDAAKKWLSGADKQELSRQKMYLETYFDKDTGEMAQNAPTYTNFLKQFDIEKGGDKLQQVIQRVKASTGQERSAKRAKRCIRGHF